MDFMSEELALALVLVPAKDIAHSKVIIANVDIKDINISSFERDCKLEKFLTVKIEEGW